MARRKRQHGSVGAQTAPTAALAEALAVSVDPELLVLALTHRSFAHEAGGLPTNERLEFLGDTVLGLCVTEALYRRFPEHSEGDLARMRSAVVSQRPLAAVAREIELGSYVLLGRGEQTTGGRDKDSILADTVEAVLGAVYLTNGLEVSRALIHRLLDETIEQAAGLGAGLDWKTSLQEAAALAGLPAPEYHASWDGPDHARVFVSWVSIDGQELGRGTGTAKKHAEQQAAEAAFRVLEERYPGLVVDTPTAL